MTPLHHRWGVLLPLLALGFQPCGPCAGGELQGEVAPPPADWSFSDEYSRCHLEVNPEDPHSVTTSCFVYAGALHVPAMMAEHKRWTNTVLEDPRVRVRIGEQIYEMNAALVSDPERRLAAARAAYEKYHDGKEAPADLRLPEGRWIFRLSPR